MSERRPELADWKLSCPAFNQHLKLPCSKDKGHPGQHVHVTPNYQVGWAATDDDAGGNNND